MTFIHTLVLTMHNETAARTSLGQRLSTSRVAQGVEIVSLFAVAGLVIMAAKPFVGEDPLMHQAAVWVANLVMLALVWTGLHLRGQSWDHLGLHFSVPGWKTILWGVLKSVAVFVSAIAAFVLGSVIVGSISGVPESADMSGYNYLQGNLPMLLLALAAVYVVSSFGEEVIYRGFLITRLAEMGTESAWAWRTAVGVSAVVFGFIHFDWGVMGIVQTGFMGLALGIAYLVLNRNLWVLILAHVYLDTILLVQLYLSAG